MDNISTFTLPSCAASFTCSFFTCHSRAAWGFACVCWAWVPPLEDDNGQNKHLHAPVKIFGREKNNLSVHKAYCKAPMASVGSNTILRMSRSARINLLFCRSGLWLASTRARLSGSASAVSESCLLDSMTSARSSRAIVRHPTWIA